MPGCRGGANVKAQAQERAGRGCVARLCAHARKTHVRPPPSLSIRWVLLRWRLSVRSRPTMGSGPAAGSVRARYLVYFQYLGTDFKYVFRTSLGAQDPHVQPGAAGSTGS